MSEETEGNHDIRAELRLRPDRLPVTRLSRKVLVGLSVVAGFAVAGALIFALQSRRGEEKAIELYSTENKPMADKMASLPRDYSAIPKLGPPLPGDLGRPILRAQGQGEPVLGSPTDPSQQRLAQEQDAARTSKLFARTTSRERSREPLPGNSNIRGTSGDTMVVPAEPAPIDPGSAQSIQDRKVSFLKAPVDRRTLSPDRLLEPASTYIVQAGTLIPAALITGIRSDLPGLITAQVTENVYDTPSGRYLLIPQGSRLIGEYDSQVAFGQSRVLLVWSRLILPNGRSIVLERQAGADPKGYAGLKDDVDYHWGNLMRAAALSTLLGVGTEIGAQGDENEIVRALRRGSQDSINQSGQEIVRRQLNVQPTLTIRPGFPVRVIVNRDLMLAPYES